MENRIQCFIVLSEMDCVRLICLFGNITDFLRKRKYTGPNLSRSSEEFDILPPWKLLFVVEVTGINIRIVVYMRQDKGRLMMNKLKVEHVGRVDFISRTSPGVLLFSSN